MIAQPEWMRLTTPDPTPEHRHPKLVREVVAAVRAADLACTYAGTSHDTEVYLVEGGRLVLERGTGSLERWPTPADPNGAPMAWGHFDRSTSGATEAVTVLRRRSGRAC